jgi:type I restriction enzyme S subunit
LAPDGWTIATVDDLKAPAKGAIAIGPFGCRMKSDRYVASGVPVIRGNNIADTRELVGEMVCVSREFADTLGNAIVYPDDLVFPHRGAIGQVGIVPWGQSDRYALSTSLMKLTCDRAKVEPLYLSYYFRSAAGQHALLRNASTVGTPGIGQPLSSLRSITVPVPPLNEQNAIAAALGALDDKIALNRRTNATLEAMARALFQSWFVNFDPVRAKLDGLAPVGLDPAAAALFPAQFQDSPIGVVPQGWQVEAIRDRASNIQYGFTQSATSERVGPHFLRITDIRGGKIEWDSVPFCKASEQEGKKYRIVDGDIFVARTGASTGESVYVAEPPPAVFASYLVRIQFESRGTGRLVGEFMRSADYANHVAEIIGGSAQPNASAQAIAAAAVAFPPEEIAEAYYQIVRPLDLKRAANDRESRVLAGLRETLLPKLLSGEMRVGGSAGAAAARLGKL